VKPWLIQFNPATLEWELMCETPVSPNAVSKSLRAAWDCFMRGYHTSSVSEQGRLRQLLVKKD